MDTVGAHAPDCPDSVRDLPDQCPGRAVAVDAPAASRLTMLAFPRLARRLLPWASDMAFVRAPVRNACALGLIQRGHDGLRDGSHPWPRRRC